MDAASLFDEIAAELVPRGASTGSMFGSRALKLATRSSPLSDTVASWSSSVPGRRQHASALEIGEPFDPSGKGRPMREWIVFDADQDPATVSGFVEAAFELAQSRRA